MTDRVGELERGRDSFAAQAWAEAYAQLSSADVAARLEAPDLELLATSAYMLGRHEDYFATLERAHRARLDAGEVTAATRCAFWIGINLAQRGEMGRAGGWLGRAQRLLEPLGDDVVERGYLQLPRVFEQEAGGELEAAAQTAAEAARIGQRFDDADLIALAAHEHGHILIRLGRPREGLALLDQSMLSATSGELSPIATGIVYCGVVLACQDAHEARRAAEWTAALSEWCDRQPDLVAFTGRCRVHRAEIMQLRGSWREALEEAERAIKRCLDGENPRAAGEAAYRKGEIHRLMGDFDAAEAAYRDASERGWDPQPGFALLRLAQGNTDAAEAAIRRAGSEAVEPARRASLLPAFAEVMTSVDDNGAARAACDELDAFAGDEASEALAATAAQTRGVVELSDGAAGTALRSLRRAAAGWQELGAPYQAARAGELIALACRELGDEDAALLELGAARAAFARLGARPDLARIEALAELAAAFDTHGLTERELEVLRHLAAGETNRAIATQLVLSVRTIDRHVSNIYAKLGVSSRAAATAHAHQHGLL